MKKYKNKGITLIALVITIVVLIILALISINAVFGENGIVKRAEYSEELTAYTKAREEVVIEYANVKTQDLTEGLGELTIAEALEENLKKEDGGAKVYDNQPILDIYYKTYDFQIDEYGNVSNDYTNIGKVRIIDIGTNGHSIYWIDSKGGLGIKGFSYGISMPEPIKIDTEELKDDYVSGIEGKVIKYIYSEIYYNSNGYAFDDKGNVYEVVDNIATRIDNYYDESESTSNNDIFEAEGSALKGKEIVAQGRQIAIDTEGKVYTWGISLNGELGTGTTDRTEEELPICISDLPGSALSGRKITKIYSDYGTIIVADENGKLYTWGRNWKGELGNGTINQDSGTPTCISDLQDVLKDKKIINFYLFDDSAFAIDSQGKVYSWGYNKGTLGNGETEDTGTPICISDLTGSDLNGVKIEKIYSDDSYYCQRFAIDSNGNIYGWGKNNYGQVGNGTNTDVLLPVCLNDVSDSILKGKKIIDIATYTSTNSEGDYAFCMDKNRYVYMWGYNRGQFGIGNTSSGNMPVSPNWIEDNPLYQKRIKYITNGGYKYIMTLITEDGDGYYFGGIPIPS